MTVEYHLSEMRSLFAESKRLNREADLLLAASIKILERILGQLVYWEGKGRDTGGYSLIPLYGYAGEFAYAL